MTERPLMTADELKSLKKGSFIVMKTGTHPFVSQLKLFMKWGITFPIAYEVEDRGARRVDYVSLEELVDAILDRYAQRKEAYPQAADSPGGPTESEQEMNRVIGRSKPAKPLRTE